MVATMKLFKCSNNFGKENINFKKRKDNLANGSLK